MLIVSHNSQTLHNPKYEIFNGDKTPHAETSLRVKNIEKILKYQGFTINNKIENVPNSLLYKIHNAKYITFIRNTCNQLQVNKYIYPSVFKIKGATNSVDITAQIGRWSSDTYTPLSTNTYRSAFAAASVAYTVAKNIMKNKHKVGYALCRPPGHHASSNLMGGYCYLNNSAIAAHYLSEYGKVAILDIDLHHGNGTQEIFYKRSDVLTISIHADPRYKFPYYSGYKNEMGENEGKGYNYNFPLSKNTDNALYQKTLIKTLAIITKYNPKYIVVPLGLDTFEKDPIGYFKLTTSYYKSIAESINKLNIPTVIVQEGGYDSKELGLNVASFLAGFK